MLKLFVAILFFSWAVRAEVAINVFGNPVDDPISDALILEASGKASLQTISVFPYDDKNQQPIGRFTHTIAAAEVDRAKKMAAEATALIKTREPIYPESIVFEVSVDKGKPTRWMVGDKRPAMVAMEKFFVDLKKQMMAKPKAALALTCRNEGSKVACFYKNIGAEPLKTVNPIGVDNALYCYEPDGKRRALQNHFEEDPQKLKPESVVLKPDTSYTFSFPVAPPCAGKILARTSIMRVNDKYKDHVLGDIFSNSIP